ncbi:hypothetical protein ABE504_01620 [Paenibacillus oryzisoli]|uniref:hypothetical protein n=1 Tax=Paenibacillus oryzisoli TaxID=1850517 RepID=UPI003D2AA54B
MSYRKPRGFLKQLRELGLRKLEGVPTSSVPMTSGTAQRMRNLRIVFAAKILHELSVRAKTRRARRPAGRKVVPFIRKEAPRRFIDEDLWELRRHIVLQLAKRLGGRIKLQDVAAECNVHIRTAADWLGRLATEGRLALVTEGHRLKVYALKEVDPLAESGD